MRKPRIKKGAMLEKIPKSIVLKTKRLTIRTFRQEDEKLLFEKANDFLITQFLPFEFDSLEKCNNYASKAMSGFGKSAFSFLAFSKKSSELVGSVNLHDFSKKSKHADIGLWVLRKDWRQGFGKEMIEAILNFGFRKLKLNRIGYYVFEGNAPSEKLVSKFRGKFEGTRRKYFLKNGKFFDEKLYSILASEWKKKK